MVFGYDSTIDEELPAIREFIKENFTQTTMVMKLLNHLTNRMDPNDYNGAEVNFSYKGVLLLTLKPNNPSSKIDDSKVYKINIDEDGKLFSTKDWIMISSILFTSTLVGANSYGFITLPNLLTYCIAAMPAIVAWTL